MSRSRHLHQIWSACTIGGAYRPSAAINFALRRNVAPHGTGAASSTATVSRAIHVLLTIVLLALSPSARAEPFRLEVFEIAPGVYAHAGEVSLMTAENHGGIANLGFVVGSEAVAVIDTGGGQVVASALRDAVRRVTDKPVRWVVNTHMHPDHVFGNAAFLGPDVAFVGHVRLADALRSRFDHYVAANRQALGADDLSGVTLVLPTVTVADRFEIDLGGRVLELRAWPTAHTDNDLTVFDRQTGTLFAGDLVFLDHLPSIDGSLRGWQAAIQELARIPVRHLVPGHGPLDPPWPAALDPQRTYFEVLARDVKAAIDAGTPMSQAVLTAGRSEAGKWRLFDEFNVRNATAAYAELEWE